MASPPHPPPPAAGCLCRYAGPGGFVCPSGPSEVAPCDRERLGLDASRTGVFSPDRDDNGARREDYRPRLSKSAAICVAVSWPGFSLACSQHRGSGTDLRSPWPCGAGAVPSCSPHSAQHPRTSPGLLASLEMR